MSKVNINDFKHTLDSLFGKDAQFISKKVTEWREHNEDRKVVMPLLGYKYNVANLDFVIKVDVKIEGDTPIITNDKVQKSSTPIIIAFQDTAVSFYGAIWDAGMTVTASKATIVPPKAAPPIPPKK